MSETIPLGWVQFNQAKDKKPVAFDPWAITAVDHFHNSSEGSLVYSHGISEPWEVEQSYEEVLEAINNARSGKAL